MIKKVLPHLSLPVLINFMTCNQITGCTEAIIKKKVILFGLFAQQLCSSNNWIRSPKIFDQTSWFWTWFYPLDIGNKFLLQSVVLRDALPFCCPLELLQKELRFIFSFDFFNIKIPRMNRFNPRLL